MPEDGEGRTLSHYAIWHNKTDMLQFLLSRGADIEAKDNVGRNLLFSAVHSISVNGASLDLVKLLLEKNINIDTGYTSDYYTPLYHAIYSGDASYDLVKQLLDYGANPYVKDGLDGNLLYYAARKGGKDIAELLLDKGVDINAYTKCYKSPLSIAIEKNHIDLAKTLIDRGANISIDQGGNINLKLGDVGPLLYVVDDNIKRQIVDFLKDRVIYTPLHYAAREGKLNLIVRLLNRGNDVNAKDANGWTPLHYAAWKGKLDAAKLLVERGAKANPPSNETPLAVASRYQKSQVESFLRTKQSECDKQLLSAVESGNVSKVTDLLNRGANVNARDDYAWTPLHYAAKEKKLDILNHYRLRAERLDIALEARREAKATPILY